MPGSRSPKVLKGALVLLDDQGAGAGAPAQVVVFQYNPDTLYRRLEKRPSGPPQEVITCSLAFDATDALEFPDENPLVVEHGIYPMLAALELLMHPREAPGGGSSWWPFWPFGSGSEVEHEPVLIFLWGDQRAVPVRLTRLDITEEQHDPELQADPGYRAAQDASGHRPGCARGAPGSPALARAPEQNADPGAGGLRGRAAGSHQGIAWNECREPSQLAQSLR